MSTLQDDMTMEEIMDIMEDTSKNCKNAKETVKKKGTRRKRPKCVGDTAGDAANGASTYTTFGSVCYLGK